MSPSRVLLDAGVFIGVANGSLMTASLVSDAARDSVLFVAAHTFAEFYRGGARSAREARLLRLWQPQPLDVTPEAGKLAGTLLAKTGRNNSMDALLVAVGALRGISEIYTTDLAGIIELARALAPQHRPIAVTDAR